MNTPELWAIVPLKSLDQAKQRLASVLSPDERRLLMLAMARDVLSGLSRAARLTGILIVSRTAQADALAQTFGTERFAESPDADLSESLAQASEHLAEHFGAGGVMIIPADVPLIDPAEVDLILSAHVAAGERVTIVPDDENLGTNTLICTPPSAIPYLFDGKSFKPHTDAAYASGCTPRIVQSESLALDIDTPMDLKLLLARGRGSQTGTFLEKSGIAARLKAPHNSPLDFRG